VNRDNRIVSLTATASKARGLEDRAEGNLDADHPSRDVDRSEGDITTTVLRCVGGETVIVNHDVSLPRPDDSKTYHVQGTDELRKRELDAVTSRDGAPTTSGSRSSATARSTSTRSGRPTGRRGSGRATATATTSRYGRSSTPSHGTSARRSTSTTPPPGWRSRRCPSSRSRWGAPVAVPEFTDGAWTTVDILLRLKAEESRAVGVSGLQSNRWTTTPFGHG